MNILFITSTRIGDAVLSSAILSYMVKKYPNSKITIACGPLAAPLFEQTPYVEKFIVFRDRRMGKHWFKLLSECIFTRWDITIDLRGSISTYFLLSKKRYIWRSVKTLDHKVQQLANLLGIKEKIFPKIWLSKKDQLIAENELPNDAPIIALAPAANWKGKEWPPERYLSLINNIISSKGLIPYAYVAIFAAKHERERIRLIIDGLSKNRCIDLIGKYEILKVASYLDKCSLFIGNDSGLMHISSALGVPTVGLFGPSRVENFAPYGPKCIAVRTPISYEELMKDLHRKDNFMESLTEDSVLSTVKTLWKNLNKTDY